jgi:hypothetical protein
MDSNNSDVANSKSSAQLRAEKMRAKILARGNDRMKAVTTGNVMKPNETETMKHVDGRRTSENEPKTCEQPPIQYQTTKSIETESESNEPIESNDLIRTRSTSSTQTNQILTNDTIKTIDSSSYTAPLCDPPAPQLMERITNSSALIAFRSSKQKYIGRILAFGTGKLCK